MATRTALRLFAAIVLLVLPFAGSWAARGEAAPDVPTYALVNARIVPVSARPIPSGTLVLRDGKIAAIGPNVDPPPDAIVMDANGWTLYPGFVDAHSAIGMPNPPALPQNNIERTRAIQARQRAGKPTPGLTPQLTAVAAYEPDRDALQAARLKQFGQFHLEHMEISRPADYRSLAVKDFKQAYPLDITFNPFRLLKSFFNQFYEIGIKEKLPH